MLPTLYEEKETSEEDKHRADRMSSVSNFLAFSASWGRFYGQSSPLVRVRICLLRRNLKVLRCYKRCGKLPTAGIVRPGRFAPGSYQDNSDMEEIETK
jgi:hypothetical protein